MTVAGLRNTGRIDPHRPDHPPQFLQRQRGVQGLAKELLLVRGLVAGVLGDELFDGVGRVGAEQVPHEEQAAWADDAPHLREGRFRLRDVMHDAVGHDDVERGVGVGESLRIDQFQRDVLQPDSRDVSAGDGQHLAGEVDRG